MSSTILTPAALTARTVLLHEQFREYLRVKASHELVVSLIYEDPQGRLKGRTRRPNAQGELVDVILRLSEIRTPLADPPTAEAILRCATDRFLRREADRTGRPLAEVEAEVDPDLLADVRAVHTFEICQRLTPQAARLALAEEALTTPHQERPA